MSHPELYVQVENTETRGHAPNRSFLRGQLWFRCLPYVGKRDCAAGLMDQWLVGTGVSQTFRDGAAEAATEWEAEHNPNRFKQPAAGYDPEHDR